MATLQMAAGLLGGGNFGQAASRGLTGYQNTMSAANEAAALEEERAYVKQQRESKAAQEQRKRDWLAQNNPAALAMQNGQGPTVGNAANLDPVQQQRWGMASAGVMGLDDYAKSLLPQPRKLMTVKAGDMVLDESNPTKPLFSAPEKVDYNKPFLPDGTPNTAFQDYSVRNSRAGATNIGLPRIEIKTGESIASQVGPMAKDSRIQAQGAVKMFDAAERIEKAIASGMVSSGPFATQIQTVKQLVQKVGGGSDEGIRQTRQVIKSLAQMAVEARKQLQGQGQVTETEAAAVAKADAGDINDLTVGELQDLVTLTKRASHYTAKSHAELIGNMESGEATKGVSKFYQVPGLDGLLSYEPKLPVIGGKSQSPDAVNSLVEKYRSK